MKINSLEDADNILRTYIVNSAQLTGDNLSLDRMFPLLKSLGNPHEKLKVIHIAGTSGKTSTAYYISSILSSSGFKVGLTVSPHVDSITERIQINNNPISESAFCEYLGVFIDLISNLNNKPSYFEIMIAFVYWVLEKEKVNYAVIETGMGGLLDSTNVASRSDKVCVITDIGFDHMHVLGNSLREIAFQKAGIIHKNNQVFMYKQSTEIMTIIEKVIRDKKAKLQVVQYLEIENIKNKDVNIPLFQKKNWNLAKQVCTFIAKRDKFEIDNPKTALDIIVPGRMETFNLDDGTILIMDGAHNGQKIATFVSSFKEIYPNHNATILLALKSGKEYIEVIDKLSEITQSIILTTFNTSQDLPATAVDPKTLKNYCDKKNISSEIINEPKQAYEKLLTSSSKIKLVIGSFFLLGQVRK